MKEALEIGAPLLVAVIGYLVVLLEKRHRRTKRIASHALKECRRFAELEETYCGLLCYMTWHKTPLAAKRWARAIHRGHGDETPTVTSQEIVRALEKV
jgi:hypothetical protein